MFLSLFHLFKLMTWFISKFQGFELLDPFVPILVEQYSEKEIESAIDYYIDRLWINSEKGKFYLSFSL